jgi:segregation and condensation protein B
LVRITGRHDSLGRPQLYGTTKKVLQSFGLNSLTDLPEVEALSRGAGKA